MLDESLLIFDYFLHNGKGMAFGSISDEDIINAKRIYVFVSHNHGDHYNPRIFEWDKLCDNVKYLLDDTVTKNHEKAVKLSRGDTFDDGYLKAAAFGSTDIGGCFFVETEGISLFHAGDLNNWHWKDEGDGRYSRQMQRFFERELKYLRANVEEIDYAFFPVDKRMGSDYDEGADMFLDVMKPGNFVPIHFVDFADTRVFADKHKNSETKIYAVQKNGDKLI